MKIAGRRNYPTAKVVWDGYDAMVILQCPCGHEERADISTKKPFIECEQCAAVYDLSISVTCHRR